MVFAYFCLFLLPVEAIRNRISGRELSEPPILVVSQRDVHARLSNLLFTYMDNKLTTETCESQDMKHRYC